MCSMFQDQPQKQATAFTPGHAVNIDQDGKRLKHSIVAIPSVISFPGVIQSFSKNKNLTRISRFSAYELAIFTEYGRTTLNPSAFGATPHSAGKK